MKIDEPAPTATCFMEGRKKDEEERNIDKK